MQGKRRIYFLGDSVVLKFQIYFRSIFNCNIIIVVV